MLGAQDLDDVGEIGSAKILNERGGTLGVGSEKRLGDLVREGGGIQAVVVFVLFIAGHWLPHVVARVPIRPGSHAWPAEKLLLLRKTTGVRSKDVTELTLALRKLGP